MIVNAFTLFVIGQIMNESLHTELHIHTELHPVNFILHTYGIKRYIHIIHAYEIRRYAHIIHAYGFMIYLFLNKLRAREYLIQAEIALKV